MDTATASPKKARRDRLADVRAQASNLRRQAGKTLDRSGSRHRLTLLLSYVTAMTVAMGLYVLSSGAYTLASLLINPEVISDDLLSSLADLLFALLCLFILLPLLSGAWRLACLMTAPAKESIRGHAVTASPPTLSQLFYPFTSPRAYGRSLAVGLEALGWILLTVAVPCLLYSAFRLTITTGVLSPSPTLRGILTALCLLLCILWGLVAFFLSGRRAGFGYFVFLHEQLSLRDADRYFRSFRRPPLLVLLWRLPLLGWALISVVTVLIPLLPHTLPYCVCCSAAHARYLEDPEG